MPVEFVLNAPPPSFSYDRSYGWSVGVGATQSTHGGVCVGEAGNCVGMEQGGSLYFDRSGGFSGMTIYTELYLQIAGESRISIGYEAGLLGMEGRELYAGVSAFGVHAVVSHIEDGYEGAETNWGFEERVYLAYGNNTSISAEDGKTTSLVSAELWLPNFGRFGHFTFGERYDVSDNGLRKAMLDEIIPILKEHPEIIGEDRLAEIEKGKIDMVSFLRIGRALRKSGYEMVEHLNGHSDGYSKTTFRKSGSMGYGNIELMSSVRDNRAYSSYNYGNNVITHLIIDWGGWKGRGY